MSHIEGNLMLKIIIDKSLIPFVKYLKRKTDIETDVKKESERHT